MKNSNKKIIQKLIENPLYYYDQKVSASEREKAEQIYKLLGHVDEYVDGETAIIAWGIDDVIETGKNIDVKIKKKDAKEILAKIKAGHNAEVGINWEVIEVYIQEHYETVEF